MATDAAQTVATMSRQLSVRDGGNFCLHDTKRQLYIEYTMYVCVHPWSEMKIKGIKLRNTKNKTKNHIKETLSSTSTPTSTLSPAQTVTSSCSQTKGRWWCGFLVSANVCNTLFLLSTIVVIPGRCRCHKLMSIARRPRQTAAIWSDTFFARIARWKIVQAK